MALKLLNYVFCLFFLFLFETFFFHFLKIKHHTRFKWKKLSFQRICWVTRVWIANLSRYLSNCDKTFKRYDYFMTAFKTTSGNSLWRNFKPHSCHVLGSFLFTKPNMRFTIFEQKINSQTINFALPLCVIIMILTLVHVTAQQKQIPINNELIGNFLLLLSPVNSLQINSSPWVYEFNAPWQIHPTKSTQTLKWKVRKIKSMKWQCCVWQHNIFDIFFPLKTHANTTVFIMKQLR